MLPVTDCGLNKGEHVDCRGREECLYRRHVPCVTCGTRVISVSEDLDAKAICSIGCWDKNRGADG